MSRSTGRHAAPRHSDRRTPARRPARKPSRHSTATKLVASVALVAGSASVAGLGTFGAFTDTTTANQAVSSGTVKLGQTTGNTNLKAEGLVPGDTVQRTITLTREAGSDTFGAVTLRTNADPQNVLVTDQTHGLKMTVEQCSDRWTPSADNLTFTCSGITTPAAPTGPAFVAGRVMNLPVDRLNSDAKTSHLRVTLTLPVTAGNEFQGKAANLTFTFDALQRPGRPK